jgi:hypothetical protein
MGRTTFFTVAAGETPKDALNNALAGDYTIDELTEDAVDDKDRRLVEAAKGIHTDEQAGALATALEYDSRFENWWDPITYVELSPVDSQRRYAFFGWMRG